MPLTTKSSQPSLRSPERSDEELAAVALGAESGNREALGELLARYAEALTGFFQLRFRDASLAEDLAQEVFVRVIRSGQTFDRSRRFRPWLWTIAHNLARTSHIRRAAAPPVRSLDEDSPDEAPLHDRVSDPRPSPRRRLADEQRAERLRAALVLLEEPHRDVLLLKYFQDLPCREVAQILGVSEGTVWSRTHRALTRMGELLGPEMSLDEGDLT